MENPQQKEWMKHAHSMINELDAMEENEKWKYDCDAEGCQIYSLEDGSNLKYRKYIMEVKMSAERLGRNAHKPELRDRISPENVAEVVLLESLPGNVKIVHQIGT